MANGELWTIKLHNDGLGGQIIDSVTVKPINSVNAVTGINSVRLLFTQKNNYFFVRMVYNSADIATTPFDFTATVALATAAISAKFGPGSLLI
jgi:hypothetical protein